MARPYALPMSDDVRRAGHANADPRGAAARRATSGSTQGVDSGRAVRLSKTRVSSKHQVTIPAAAFRVAGLREGDTLHVMAEGAGRVVLTRVDELLDRYSGALSTGGALRRRVDELSDEWP